MQYSENTLDQFISLIRQVVREELQREKSNFYDSVETCRHVKVLEVNSELVNEETGETKTVSATVQDMATKEIIEDVSNKSGEILSEGDIVRLYETNGNYHNRYIGMNFGKE